MSKYETDSYILTTFDSRGTRIDQIKFTQGGLMHVREIGFDLIRDGKCASFNVHRNIFNSLDKNEPWEVK